jgi:hypothetical protein
MSILKKINELIKGKDLKYIWEQFTVEKNGTLKSTSGDLFVEYAHSSFCFKITNHTHYITSGGRTYEKKYMIGIVQFNNPTKFELCLTKEDFLTKIGKIFNIKDIKINNAYFDTKYFLKSNYEYKATSILKNEDLLNLIITLNPDRIEITNKNGLFDEIPDNGKYMLYFAKQEKLKTIDQLYLIHSTLNSFIEILKNNYSIH